MSSTETQLDVLAVFSHPDDAELSVAGTLLKLKSLGYRTGVCDLTRGGRRWLSLEKQREGGHDSLYLRLIMRSGAGSCQETGMSARSGLGCASEVWSKSGALYLFSWPLSPAVAGVSGVLSKV